MCQQVLSPRTQKHVLGKSSDHTPTRLPTMQPQPLLLSLIHPATACRPPLHPMRMPTCMHNHHLKRSFRVGNFQPDPGRPGHGAAAEQHPPTPLPTPPQTLLPQLCRAGRPPECCNPGHAVGRHSWRGGSAQTPPTASGECRQAPFHPALKGLLFNAITGWGSWSKRKSGPKA